MKIAWHFLIKLKNKMTPRLQQAGLVVLKFTVLAWNAFKKANIKLFRACLLYSKSFGKVAVRASHKTVILFRVIARRLGQSSIWAWEVTKIAARRFVQLCGISFIAFRHASIKCTRQIFQFLVFLGHLVGNYSRSGWRLLKAVVIRFVQLCDISFIAFRHASIKCTRQILQSLVFLIQHIHDLAKTVWQYFVHSLRRFITLCKISIFAFKRAAFRSGKQINQSVYILLRFFKKLALYTWHVIRTISNWFSKCTVTLAQNVTTLFNKIFYAFIWTVLKLFSIFILSIRFAWIQWLNVWEKLFNYAKLVRLDKPIGIFLLLWPTLWALWIAADGSPDLIVLLIFITGVILMRSAGCAINDFIDRNIDSHVSRTQERPLVNGIVTPREALDVAILLILAAFILVLFLNPLTILLSVVAVCLVVIYPFMKRITYLPQFFLGLAFAWSIPMAFAAQTNAVPEIAWLLLCATVLWAVAYDTMYAMVDREDDIRIGVRSTAILFDDADRFIIGCVQVMVLIALVMIGQRLEMSQYYYAGLALAAVFSVYQQFLIKDRIPENCLKAFLNNNWFGATVFAGIYCHYQYY